MPLQHTEWPLYRSLYYAKRAVVERAVFYYHLTTNGCIIMPRFAAFSSFQHIPAPPEAEMHTLKSMAKRGKIEHFRRLISFDTYPFRLPRHHSRGSRTWGLCRLNRCRVLPESTEATTKLLPKAKVKKQYVVSFRLAEYYILFLLVLIM